MTNLFDVVSVRGTQYKVIGKRPAGEGKLFGKYVFTLSDNEGNKYRYLGKAVTGNAKLHPQT